MAGYKKNQNDNFSLPIGEFDTYSARLGDNFEEKLYTERSTTWVGVCLSGYSQNSSVADKTLMITNPIQVVDLGDGTSRYKIKVMYLSNAFGTGLVSPTSISKVDLKNFNEVKLQADIDLAIDAFTEDLSVMPVFGARMLIEEYGTTPFVRQIIAESKEMYSQISRGGGSISKFGNGTTYPTTTIPDDHIFPKKPLPPCTYEYKQQNIVLLETMMTKHGITDMYARKAIIGVIMKESGLCPKSEKGNYSAGRLAEVFSVFSTSGKKAPKKQGNKFANELAKEYANNPVKLFNFTYEQNRQGKRKLGNRPGTNDGYNFRGRGFNQITFRGSYEKYSKLIGVDFLSDPEKMNEPKYAAEAAILFFVDRFKSRYAKGKPPFNNQPEANLYCAWANAGWGKSKAGVRGAVEDTKKRGTDKLKVVSGKIILNK